MFLCEGGRGKRTGGNFKKAVMVDYTQKATANVIELPQAKWWTKWLTPKAKHLGCVRMYALSPFQCCKKKK